MKNSDAFVDEGNVLKKVAGRKSFKNQKMLEFGKQDGNLDRFDKYWADYIEANPLFTADDGEKTARQKEIDKLRKETGLD